MPNPNPDTSGLTPFSAPDTSGGTVKVYGRVEKYIKDWLKAQPEGESYHVRQALREYFAQKTRRGKSSSE
jgi:hypothetical protein